MKIDLTEREAELIELILSKAIEAPFKELSELMSLETKLRLMNRLPPIASSRSRKTAI